MLTLALLVVVAAPVGAVPGTRQVVWHAAACELHTIMQVVTAEVCASRIFPAADATPANPSIAEQSDKTARKIANRRMNASPGKIPRRHYSVAPEAGECGLALSPQRRVPGNSATDSYAVRM